MNDHTTDCHCFQAIADSYAGDAELTRLQGQLEEGQEQEAEEAQEQPAPPPSDGRRRRRGAR